MHERPRTEPVEAEDPRERGAVPGPAVVAIDMGYGHLRAAAPIAEALDVAVLHCDRAPLADSSEQRLWKRARRLYESTSRISQMPWVGAPLRRILDGVTHIPHLHPYRDLSTPTAGARTLDGMIRRGMGRGLVERLRQSGAPLVTTFYSPAIAADRAGIDRVYCVVTDTDINRVWAPFDASTTRIRYLVPSERARRRLLAYGVPAANVTFTGFPLPDSLLGGRHLATARRNLASRLARLDPRGEFRHAYRDELKHFLGEIPDLPDEERIPHVVFAVGGSGAQVGMARQFLPGFRRPLREQRLRLTLVAGVRGEVAAAFESLLHRNGITPGEGADILVEPDLERYFARFHALLARADVLWTKPSEMTFFGALGVPLVFSWPVGVHERYNRRWAIEAGSGLKQRDPRWAAQWLSDYLEDGTLAAAAWNGFRRLPNQGLYRILDLLAVP